METGDKLVFYHEDRGSDHESLGGTDCPWVYKIGRTSSKESLLQRPRNHHPHGHRHYTNPRQLTKM